eukprot:gene3142-30983_t
MRAILPLAAFVTIASAAVDAFGPSGSLIRVGSWNVYYKALDDPKGQSAIIKTIDNADREQAFDMFGVVEAQGDSTAGNFTKWIQSSVALQRMKHVSGQSGYEIIALFYDGAKWKLNYSSVGEFESGRPYLVAQFLSATDSQQAPIWATVVHLNHYFLSYPDKIDTVIPVVEASLLEHGSNPTKGQVLADALKNASDATGSNVATGSAVMFGDWNEMKDAVTPRTISCCTKWAAADRFSTNYSEWRFEYDHVFYSDDLMVAPSITAPFLPYTYPGCADKCADSACTGEFPPQNTTATSQGSWHRAVHATLGRGPAEGAV